MSLSITLDSSSLEKLKKTLEEVTSRVEDLSSLEESLLEVMTKDLKARFDSSPPTTSGGEVHGGVYWKELSQSYLLMNPQRSSGRIHIDTGSLMSSLSSPKANNQVSQFIGDTYEFGTRLPYAKKLEEFGRPIVFWHQELLEKLTESVLEYYIEPLKK